MCSMKKVPNPLISGVTNHGTGHMGQTGHTVKRVVQDVFTTDSVQLAVES